MDSRPIANRNHISMSKYSNKRDVLDYCNNSIAYKESISERNGHSHGEDYNSNLKPKPLNNQMNASMAGDIYYSGWEKTQSASLSSSSSISHSSCSSSSAFTTTATTTSSSGNHNNNNDLNVNLSSSSSTCLRFDFQIYYFLITKNKKYHKNKKF